MNDEPKKHLLNTLIHKEQWAGMLQHFVDVLQINIFIVDHRGRAFLIPPKAKSRYGWKLLENIPIGYDLLNDHSSFLEKFKKQGFYLEYNYLFDLHNFAIPVKINENTVIAYMVVGPVILNRRLENSEYKKIAEDVKINAHDLLDAINEIRILSFVGIKSILDLLNEVARYIIQLNIQKQRPSQWRVKDEHLSKDLSDAAKDIYESIYLDELLISLLDVALSLTKTECGSVMVLDPQSKDLTIRASRGVDQNIAQKTRMKLGEGLAGLAAKENTSFVIHGTQSDNNRIKAYLKRPEIKHALVAPILSQSSVFGVLNVHTKLDENIIQDQSLDLIQMLSKLASVAISSIQHRNASA